MSRGGLQTPPGENFQIAKGFKLLLDDSVQGGKWNNDPYRALVTEIIESKASKCAIYEARGPPGL